VKTLKVTSRSAGSLHAVSVGGASVAAALGLRSTWFSVGVLSLQPPAPNPALSAGTRVTLNGVVRGVRGVVLEKRVSGGTWRRLRAVVPAAKTGAFTVSVKPKVTTDYRLATAKDAAASVRIRVQTLT
jgi:hypothetical protein